MFLEMKMQDITLFGLLLPAIPLNMVAVNFRYTALASLIRQIHEMAKQTTDYSRPPAILYREMQILQTRIKFVKFSLFCRIVFLLQFTVSRVAYFRSIYGILRAICCNIEQSVDCCFAIPL